MCALRCHARLVAGDPRETHRDGAKVSTRRRDEALSQLARNRHRVVTTAELRRIGYSRREIGRRVEDGRLVRRYRSVYVVGPGALTDRGEWLAAALVAAPDGVISHNDAACLAELIENGTATGVNHITSPRRISPPARIRAHQRRLPPDERTILHSVLTTTTGRTLLDCAALGATPRDLEKMLIEAYVRNFPIRPPLEEILSRYPAHRGVVALRKAARMFDGPTGRTKSDLEEDYREFLARHGFPAPLRNHVIATHSGSLEVDCAWPAQRVAIELDAPSTHGSRPRMLRDRRRDRALVLAGWTPGRLMDEDLLDEVALIREMTGLLDP